MRKSYVKILTFGAAVALCAMAGNADAKVGGRCDNCHTMHNSQNGQTWPGNTTTPKDSLTTNTCAGCHTADSGTTYGINTVTFAPAVVVTTSTTPSDQSKYLPGGFITMGTNDSNKHNVKSVDTGKDSKMPDFAPPGYDTSFSSIGLPGSVAGWNPQLTCAGAYGCHGVHTTSNETLAIAGGHHNDTAVGFRLLAGIHGVEGDRAVSTPGVGDQKGYFVSQGVGGADKSGNVYDGASASSDNYADKNTISYLCAECHGMFHKTSKTGTSTPFLRHPTDIVLTQATRPDKYSDYGKASREYSADAPVGKDVGGVYRLPVGSGGGDTEALPAAGQGSVLCISCHRAHGSNQPDLLRWNYGTMIAGGGGAVDTGCFYCHTNKD